MQTKHHVLALLVATVAVVGSCAKNSEFTISQPQLNGVTKLAASDGSGGDRFGYGVSVSGDSAVFGAPWHDAFFYDAGAAYVFEVDKAGSGDWIQVKKLAEEGDVAQARRVLETAERLYHGLSGAESLLDDVRKQLIIELDAGTEH